MAIKQDISAIANGLEAGLKGLLNDLIDGTIEELDGPIREASQRLSLAVAGHRPELAAEVRDQLALLVLEKRLRLQKMGSGMFERVLLLGMNALVNGAIAGLVGIKVV
jgi:hypothetical protein